MHIVGVLPREARLVGLDADIWRPLRFTAAEQASLNRYLLRLEQRDIP